MRLHLKLIKDEKSGSDKLLGRLSTIILSNPPFDSIKNEGGDRIRRFHICDHVTLTLIHIKFDLKSDLDIEFEILGINLHIFYTINLPNFNLIGP